MQRFGVDIGIGRCAQRKLGISSVQLPSRTVWCSLKVEDLFTTRISRKDDIRRVDTGRPFRSRR